MKKASKKILPIGFIIVLAIAFGIEFTYDAHAQKKVTIYYFYGKNCPHCVKAEPIIQNLARRYHLNLKKFEVWYNDGNRNKLVSMAKERGKSVQGVPTIIIGKAVYTGSNEAKLVEIVKQNAK